MRYATLPLRALAVPVIGDGARGDRLALVSPEDFDALASREWRALWTRPGDERYCYPHAFTGRGRFVSMHRLVARRALGPAEPGAVVDHVNGDTLDCRRGNLRYASKSENKVNWHRALTSENVRLHRFTNAAAATGFLTPGVLALRAAHGEPTPMPEIRPPGRRRPEPPADGAPDGARRRRVYTTPEGRPAHPSNRSDGMVKALDPVRLAELEPADEWAVRWAHGLAEKGRRLEAAVRGADALGLGGLAEALRLDLDRTRGAERDALALVAHHVRLPSLAAA